ncbi:hypothetical protein [Desulfobacula phenolica]|uniref:Uncharacterized protein n=1 Tax=Desulfobacula phenolica TaxID=90732 RepID=A0A1H2ID76_9BACT|nr:hypothetical protein [Desulfobacula phenolica]SDU42082.1 hypothetical protein SAMN04487931_10898 [Desulfobacula phenolica]
MPNLFSKDEDLFKSAPYIGAMILKLFEKTGESHISIFDVVREIKKTNKSNIRSVYYGMLFLYSIDIIDFEEPYLISKC